MGMAVDAKGNIYGANHGVNQILVYNSSSQQMTSKTITKGINGPMQLAFDPLAISSFRTSSPALPLIRAILAYLQH
jgi:hypothetical protein